MANGRYIGLERDHHITALDITSNGALNDINKQLCSGGLLQKPEFAQIATLEAKYGNADRETDTTY